MKTKVFNDMLSESDKARIFASIEDEFKTRPIIYEDAPSVTVHGDGNITYWKDFGRIDIKYPNIPKDIVEKLWDKIKDSVDKSFVDLHYSFVIYAEYTKKSGGFPMLTPHFDGSTTSSLILDYQLESNVTWEIGVESEIFELKDNDGLFFDPLENIHYRPIKNFNDEEFVKMLFFRFDSSKPLKDKTPEDYMRLHQIGKDKGFKVEEL
jgi:hypothetical protein